MRTGTAVVAEQAAGLRFDDIPEDVVTVAKQCILDVVGGAIAGASDPAPAMVREVTLAAGDTGASSILGMPELRTSAASAALLNGVAAHVLDLDDVLTVFTGHPSAPVLPAALALAQERSATGRALLEAFVAGVETEARIGAAVAPSHYRRGFHATATVGTFGAAAAAGRILGLGADGMEQALGIAASQASGLKSEFGTMTKSLQVGKAAANGLLSARLAQRGFTGAPDVVGASQGFAQAYADELDAAVLEAPFASHWYILDVLFKAHASCHYTHSVFEAIRGLRDKVELDDVEGMTLRVHPDLLVVCDVENPQNGLEAKFSMRYVAALALARGVADVARFTDDAFEADREVRELTTRVDVIPDTATPHFCAESRIGLRGGAELSASYNTNERAWRDSPLEQTPALADKFMSLVAPVAGEAVASDLCSAILELESVDDLGVLGRA